MSNLDNIDMLLEIFRRKFHISVIPLFFSLGIIAGILVTFPLKTSINILSLFVLPLIVISFVVRR